MLGKNWTGKSQCGIKTHSESFSSAQVCLPAQIIQIIYSDGPNGQSAWDGQDFFHLNKIYLFETQMNV